MYTAESRPSDATTRSRELEPRVVYEARDRARLVDVREPDELAFGHIPGAELVPIGVVTARAAHWDRAADIIVVCRSGLRSGRVADALVTAGFRRAVSMRGGMLAYVADGLPIEWPCQCI